MICALCRVNDETCLISWQSKYFPHWRFHQNFFFFFYGKESQYFFSPCFHTNVRSQLLRCHKTILLFGFIFFMVCDFSFLQTFLLTFRRNATSCRFFLHPLAFKPSSRLPILANIITISFLFLQGTKKRAFIRPCFSCWSRKKCSQILFSFLFFSPFLPTTKCDLIYRVPSQQNVINEPR